MMSTDILIRGIEPGDAAAAARLCGELGYPLEAAEARERIDILTGSRHSAVHVACVSGEVVGWIDVALDCSLAAGRYAEIRGLLVSSEHRSHGIGRMLIRHVEAWAAAQGAASMLVRSRVSRERAHRFYLREGYSMVKTSAVFAKQLAQPSP
ncbi:MAG TPA: GNAT family N-acetyltransferase [Bryobacteraceae bacterium]|jgi:GNAT superfamily N-acetyltransferase|nr:GNAT family N-acetyltransferase [Bryobacteraceae bacterium]